MATKLTITADASQAKAAMTDVANAMEKVGTHADQAATDTTQAANRMEQQLEEVED